MENNFDNNIPTNDLEGKKGFWYSGWAYFIFLIAIVSIMVILSYVIKSFM